MSRRLKKLSIRNFRAHRKLILTFGPGVNSIIGDNAVGKSTIIRAIRYVARNKPSGESAISWDAKQARVSLTFGKNTITRTRSKRINTYRLNKKKVFRAFGTKVPDEIQKVLNLDEVNFQGQHEAPFWFCKTAGEVSRELNSIVNLDSIDKTLSSILLSISKSKVAISVINERLMEAKETKKSLSYVKDMNVQLLRIESLEKARIENNRRSILLAELLADAELYAEQADQLKFRLSRAMSVLEIALRRLKTGQTLRSLQILLKSAKKLKKLVQHKPRSFKTIQGLFKNLKLILTQAKEFNTLIEKADEILSEIKPLKQRIANRTKRIDKIMKERCPLCNKKL